MLLCCLNEKIGSVSVVKAYIDFLSYAVMLLYFVCFLLIGVRFLWYRRLKTLQLWRHKLRSCNRRGMNIREWLLVIRLGDWFTLLIGASFLADPTSKWISLWLLSIWLLNGVKASKDSTNAWDEEEGKGIHKVAGVIW